MKTEKLKRFSKEAITDVSGIITEIERYSIYDGPGIRTIIFVKGCPLRCLWCCNPETQENYIEIAFYRTKCIKCTRCLNACPHNAISSTGSGIHLNRKVCLNNCFYKIGQFPCTTECYMQAIETVGKTVTVPEVFKEIVRDYSIYERSGGGITISGGEPIAQLEFIYSLLLYCKNNWINTAIETCGYGSVEDYKKIIDLVDVFFVDLKSLDENKHKKWTGMDNKKILKTLQYLSGVAFQKNFDLYVRVPIIPGFNDSVKDINEIGLFIKNKCSGVKGVELMPYHRLGEGKYKPLGRKYKLTGLEQISADRIDILNNLLSKLSIEIVHFP